MCTWAFLDLVPGPVMPRGRGVAGVTSEDGYCYCFCCCSNHVSGCHY